MASTPLTAINEADRRGQPRESLSRRLQSVFGITHYRGINYLSKFSEDDLEGLASDLEQQVALVRQAAELVRARKA